ncbi:RNaseH [Stenotrophomonas phage vB_SmaS-DLP_6]|nr:RNaseH [Stenotrophomonas phage vB_SmaS-DLP_6]
MIIVDLQQVMIATLMRQLGNTKNAQLDENMLRHMVLNVLRSYRVKFAGEMIIACDTKYSWRKKVFPYYKAKRAKNRDESPIDWKTVFQTFDVMRAELKEYFPYRVIEVDGAEADDIIGTLSHHFGSAADEFGGLLIGEQERVLIMSGDHDFRQLLKYGNVEQFDPIQKKYIKCNHPDLYLKEHIIRGDVGDGVPNFLSDDDVFVTDKRQKSIMEKKFELWMKQDVATICDTDSKLRNWKRNEQLVDLTRTPQDIKDAILSQYESEAGKNRSKLTNYFISRKLKHLHEHINEF